MALRQPKEYATMKETVKQKVKNILLIFMQSPTSPKPTREQRAEWGARGGRAGAGRFKRLSREERARRGEQMICNRNAYKHKENL
jgi:hypothetical protein